MRLIRFRGKDIENGEWVYGFLTEGRRYNAITDDIESVPIIENLGSDNPAVEIAPNSLGQFTGLTDINGREIFEDDIVKVRVTDDRFKKNPRFRNGVVAFCKYDGGWTTGGFDDRFYPRRMEVIGNIHDNPELLEGGEK